MSTRLIPQLRRTTIGRYSFAVAVTAIALGLKLVVFPLIAPDLPFLLFFAAVIISAAVGGLGPGLLATFLAAISDNFFFTTPLNTFSFGEPQQQVRFLLFVAESAIISVICYRLQAAREHAETSAAEARELERRILEISDEEQRRIGHDLHDGLGQHLTGISLIAKRLEKRLQATQSPDAEEAAKVAGLAKTAVEWTHDLCRHLSPPALDSAGLAEALRELAANAESIFKITCTFEQAGNTPAVDVGSAVHFYRIAQEAISNAVRHGIAKRVSITLEPQETGVVMKIRDDGTGIDLSAVSANGMGIRVMRYRARMIGAEIDVRPCPEGGTEVACRYNPSKAALNSGNHVN